MAAVPEGHGWRRNHPVLVTDAQTMGSVGIIRSLGRAGYPVHVCSQDPDALGFRSRFARHRIRCPSYGSNEFPAWLREYRVQHELRAIVPSEGFLLAIRPQFNEFAPLLPLSQNASVVYQGMSKFDLFESLIGDAGHGQSTASNLPPSLLIRKEEGLPATAALKALPLPLFLKVDGSHGIDGADSATYKATTVSEAEMRLASLLSQYDRVLVQGYVPGRGAGAFCLSWNGEIRADFMHLRLHEVPHTGGASSYRKSWRHDAILADAKAKLQCVGWQGVAMMEYRWNPENDRFALMEMNGRFWGSLHLALYAGVDFPVLLLDSFHGHPPPQPVTEWAQVRCRHTFPKEVQYVWSRLKDPALGHGAKLWSLFEFLLLLFDPVGRSDLNFRGDRMLYWIRLWRFIRTRA